MASRFRSRSTNGESSSRSPLKSHDVTDFLFVNETSDSPAYKVGGRQELRSHVRKGAARLFKQKHTTRWKRGAEEPKWMPLAPQVVYQNSPERPIEDQEGPSCFQESSSLQGLSEGDPLAPLTALADRDYSACPESRMSANCMTQDVDDTTEPSKLNPLEDTAYYLNGQDRRTRAVQRGPGSRTIENSALGRKLQMNPLEILGAGRVDPFMSYPVDKPDKTLHEVMDYLVTYLVPKLRPDDSPRSGANNVSKAWFAACLSTPMLFHGCAYASQKHMELSRWSRTYPDSPRALSHKLIVIQKIKEAISGEEFARDEVILGIFTLAVHDILTAAEEARKPFQAPLKEIAWLNIYGNMTCTSEHMKAVSELLALRGGPKNLQMPGLAETLIAGDIITATNRFSKPCLPLLRIHEDYNAIIKVWATAPPRMPVRTLASAFLQLQEFGITDAMLEVFETMGSLTLAIHHYILGRPDCVPIGQIARTRMACQNRLLLLPSFEELAGKPAPCPEIYECCRLTAMIFSIAVLHPIPNSYDVLQTYVTHLKAAVQNSGLETCAVDDPRLSGVFMWILVLGALRRWRSRRDDGLFHSWLCSLTD